MTSSARGFVYKGCSTTDESAVTSSSNYHESLTTLNSGGSITSIAFVFIDGERFSGDGRLIDLDESILSDDATVCGDDGTFFNLDDIAGDDFGGFEFDKSTISKSDGLESECLLQFFDNGTSLEFLDETDSSVEKEQSADDTEIDPILKTSGKNSSSLNETLARGSTNKTMVVESYLHDELNWTNKVSEELLDQVFFFLSHLIQTIFLATLSDLLGS